MADTINYFTQKDVDDIVKTAETINREDYSLLPKRISDGIIAHAEEATAQADPMTKNVVMNSVTEVADEIKKTNEVEDEYIANPKNWTDLTKNEVTHLHAMLDNLGSFVGAKAKNAQDNIKNKAGKILEATQNVTKACGRLIDRLKFHQRNIQKEAENMRENLSDMEKKLALAKEMLDKGDFESEKEMELAKKNYENLMKKAAIVYLKTQLKSPKLIVSYGASVFESMKDSLNNLKENIHGLIPILKAGKGRVTQPIAKAFRDSVDKTEKYVTQLHDGLDESIKKGKAVGETLKHMRLATSVNLYDNRDIGKAKMGFNVEQLVEKCAKNGYTAKQTEEMLKATTRDVYKSGMEAMKNDRNQQIFKSNEPKMARA